MEAKEVAEGEVALAGGRKNLSLLLPWIEANQRESGESNI